MQANRLEEAKAMLEEALVVFPAAGCVHQGVGALLLQQQQQQGQGKGQELLQKVSNLVYCR